MPLTLQETVVSVAPVTVAAKVCVLPKRSETVAGVMVTVIEEGVGGGTTAEPAPPLLPAQPTEHAAVARRARIGSAAKSGCAAPLDSVQAFCGRGRMCGEMQAKGHGRERGAVRGLVCQREGDDAVSCSIWEC
jgi:hypothetical protein